MKNDFIKNLEEKSNIKIFSFSDCKEENNFYKCGRDGRITGLYLYEVNLQNLDVLLPIANDLKDLYLEDCQIKNLKSIKHFPNLEKLNLGGNPLLPEEFRELVHLQELIDLDLSRTKIKDTTPIGELLKLKSLTIRGTDELFSVRNLDSLKNLEELDLNFSEIDCLRKISVNENIRSINLYGSEISKIEGVDRYPNLIDLNLGSTAIDKIQELESLKNLKRLHLSSTNIIKIEGLDELKSLEILDLSYQDLDKIQGLDNLNNLRKLNLSENQIQKVENLEGVSNLELLLLDLNEISELNIDVLKGIKTKCHISLIENPIEGLDVKLPDNISIQFESSNWVPRSL